MPTVVTFTDAYLPGYRAGGPIKSVSAIVDISPDFHFKIITRDRDLGESDKYQNVIQRHWTRVRGARVAYLGSGIGDVWWAWKEIRRQSPDYYYFNSLHSPEFTLLPLLGIRLRMLPHRPVIVAPRGEVSAGARSRKKFKKAIWRPVIRELIGKSVVWHASSDLEARDIADWWGRYVLPEHRVVIWPDPPAAPAPKASAGAPTAKPRITFASRIDRMKGLKEAIKILSLVDSPFEFHVYGGISDSEYWSECKEMASALLPSGSFEYHGVYTPDQATDIYASSTLMILPTLGENFGHAIAESLAVGCPVVIPSTTLWTHLVQVGAGHLIQDSAAAASFVSSTLQLSEDDLKSLREYTLEVYRAWFESMESRSFDCLTNPQ